MKIYITRHGETDWNLNDKVLGRSNIPLNETGRAQAKKLANELKKNSIKAIYSSPLDRALETAEIIGKEINIKPIVRSCLIEQDFGIYEGRDRFDEEYQKAKREYFKRYPKGESFFEMAARIYPFLDEIKNLHKDDVLLVSHGGICRIIYSYFNDMENDEFPLFSMENCGLLCFDI